MLPSPDGASRVLKRSFTQRRGSDNQKPSENPPGTAEALPVIPLPLRFLISRAFNTNNNEQVTGLPQWVDTQRG
jgi:hypothetical protein